MSEAAGATAGANLARRYAAVGNFESARRTVRTALKYAGAAEREELLDLLEGYVRAGA